MIPQVNFTDDERRRIAEQLPKAKEAFLANVKQFNQYPTPLLLAGDCYTGIWLEHNQDNLFLADYDPQAAWASQDVFMQYQREDGLLPFNFSLRYGTNEFFKAPANYYQVQCVYPFTRCALEIAKKTKRPASDFEKIYKAGSRYDAWLSTARNKSGKGLVEMYCEYDTGHDNDPRVTDDGIPHSCPQQDASNMPDLPIMPVLSVDLSAMCYGNRMALAELADYLGKPAEAAVWREKAAEIQQLIRQYLFDPQDEFYYDVDSRGFRKYRTEHITRLFLNKVLTQNEFDRVYERYFTTPGKEFLPAFPFPSVSVDDPHFVKSCPRNSWGSNTQGLTVLRATMWMPYYHREDDMLGLLSIWLKAAINNESPYPQEINPFTGRPPANTCNYTPSIILFLKAAELLLSLKP